MGATTGAVSAPLLIAHRAGNDPAAAAAAARVADVLEADVHLFGGRLEVRHAKTIGPIPVLWERWHLVERVRPPLVLEDLLPALPADAGLLLDLKGPDPRLGPRVLRALRAAGRPAWISARIWRTADRLRGAPGVTVMHSVGTERQLARLLRRRRPGSLQGVCVDHRILTPARVAALRERAPEVWTWPVDDRATGERLAGWGVTGLISDHPAELRP